MENMAKKGARPRRSFTPEFKAEIVELCQRGNRTVRQVIRTPAAVLTWSSVTSPPTRARPTPAGAATSPTSTWQGWLYLATVIDLASRRVVGWAVADHLKTDLVDAALTDAVVRRRPEAGLVFHSDRSTQCVSAQHARLAERHDILLSVGRRGQCWDNAVAESFFSTIKTELLHRQPWPTHTAARQAIFEYIEG